MGPAWARMMRAVPAGAAAAAVFVATCHAPPKHWAIPLGVVALLAFIALSALALSLTRCELLDFFRCLHPARIRRGQ